MKYDTRWPSINDLKSLAKRRIPNFAFDYIDAGIDEEVGKQRNRQAFHNVELTPRYMCDVADIDIRTEVFGQTYAMPFGMAPVGLGNMTWPGAEMAQARAAQKNNIPYVLSTFSTTAMEDIAKVAPDVAWFQLYVPRDHDVMEDMINRAQSAGYRALVVTLDIPVGAKRNRELKNGLKLPFSMTPKIIWQSMLHPQWALATLRHGSPTFVNVLPYMGNSNQGLAQFFSSFSMQGVDIERLARIRELWHGPLILKGIQSPDDARQAVQVGADGIVVSNHGGRQLDAAPSSVESLRSVPAEVFEQLTVMIDSGIRTGLDVVRSKALGASMAFSGRSFSYGVGALGAGGAVQVLEIYRDEITRTLQQLGCNNFRDMDQSWISGEI
jgi:(S)-mandelate dehydrogenase